MAFVGQLFQFLAHFRQLLWHNRLDIARCITTVGGHLYGVDRMTLVRNAYEEMCVQNKNIGFVFGTFLAPVWPYHLEIARCKTSVNLLLYGIGNDLLKGGSRKMCLHTWDRRTDRRTDGRTD